MTEGNKRGPGRPKKNPAKSSPVKPPDTTIDDVVDENCVCKMYKSEEVSLACDKCSVYWHISCVGLRGLTKEMVDSLEYWECPRCFVCPLTEKTPETPENRTLQLLIKEELNLINPVIRSTISDAIKECMPSDIFSKGDIKEMLEEGTSKAVKSYADITSSSQKKVIEELSAAQSTKAIVQQVHREFGVEKIEREKRKFNLCVMKAPESKKTVPKERQEEDMKFCHETLGIPKDAIETCFRAGKKSDGTEKKEFCRPLIIKMKKQEDQAYWSNNNRGYLTNNFYINPDMCKADRDAHFRVRKEAKRRRETAAGAEKKEETSS